MRLDEEVAFESGCGESEVRVADFGESGSVEGRLGRNGENVGVDLTDLGEEGEVVG